MEKMKAENASFETGKAALQNWYNNDRGESLFAELSFNFKKSMRNKIKKRWSTVLLFSSAQALFQTGSILVMALSGLVGLEIAPEKSLATLPIAMISVGTVLMMILASLIIKRWAREKHFLLGQSSACLRECFHFMLF